MTDENKPTSGGNPDDAGGNPDSGTSVGGNDNDTVSLATHRKLLGEKKRAAQQLADALAENEALKTEKKDAVDKELAQQGKYKDLYDQALGEVGKLKSDIATRDERDKNALKLSAFLEAIDGKVDREYWCHIDTDAILVDPESNAIDDMSVTKEVERFKAKHPVLVQRSNSGQNLPNKSPKVTGAKSHADMSTQEKIAAAAHLIVNG